MTTRPNILLILTDQQSSSAMSCAGNTCVNTPHMDALAGGGVRFRRAYCTSPVCGPARASLITGRMPHDIGVNVNGDAIAPNVACMGDVFRQAGYDAAWAGKWYGPRNEKGLRGFDPVPADIPHGARYGMERDERVADAAISYLREHASSDKPFVLGASLTNPHDICYWVMNHDVRATVESDAPLPPLPDNWAIDPDEPEFVRLCRQREHYGEENSYTRAWGGERWRAYLYHYYRFVEQVDGCVGRILSALRELGLERDTLVCFTTDHGEGCAAHQWVVKLMFWENVVNIPLIFRWPERIPAGETRDQLASGADIMATFCDLAGVPLPAGVAGLSLRDVLADPEASLRSHLFCELQPDTERPELLGRMVRGERLKYAAYSHGDRPEALFDMAADPGETRNLAGDTAWADELGRHRRLLSDWIAATSDRFIPPWS